MPLAMAMSLRLTEVEKEAMRAVAVEEGRSMQDVARTAIAQYVALRPQRLCVAIELVRDEDPAVARPPGQVSDDVGYLSVEPLLEVTVGVIDEVLVREAGLLAAAVERARRSSATTPTRRSRTRQPQLLHALVRNRAGTATSGWRWPPSGCSASSTAGIGYAVDDAEALMVAAAAGDPYVADLTSWVRDYLTAGTWPRHRVDRTVGSVAEHRPAELVPRPLIVEDQGPHRGGELSALPVALGNASRVTRLGGRGRSLDRVRRSAEVVRGDVGGDRRLAGGVRSEARSTGEVASGGHGVAAVGASGHHRQLAAGPGTDGVDRLTGAGVVGAGGLEEGEDVLGAGGGPEGEQVVALVGERAPAADRGQAGVAHRGQDHPLIMNQAQLIMNEAQLNLSQAQLNLYAEGRRWTMVLEKR